MKYEFLLSSLKLPVVNADYRFDLDGSGATDDQLARDDRCIDSTRLGHAGCRRDAVNDGRVLTLFTLFAERELTADQPAELRVVRALSTGAADPLAVPVTLKGKLEASKFVPTAPVENADLTT